MNLMAIDDGCGVYMCGRGEPTAANAKGVSREFQFADFAAGQDAREPYIWQSLSVPGRARDIEYMWHHNQLLPRSMMLDTYACRSLPRPWPIVP